VDLALAHRGDEHVEGLLRHPVELFDVEQGAVAEGADERSVDEHLGVVPLGEDPGRIEVTDQARRRQFGVALDELEPDAELVGHLAQERRLAGARGSLEEDVAVGGERGHHEVDLPAPAHHRTGQPGDQLVHQSKRMTPRMFSPLRIAS
jgi:hypothetical protein